MSRDRKFEHWALHGRSRTRSRNIGTALATCERLTAQEDGAALFDDASLLVRAQELGRVLVSQDDDLLRLGVERQRAGGNFSGIIYAHQLRTTIGQFVEDLELLAKATDASDWPLRIEYLPLR